MEEPFTTANRVHGRGYVRAPPARVWAGAKEPEVADQGCEATRHSWTAGGEPEYEFSLAIHYEVDKVITVAWDEDWRFGTITGTPDQPTRTMVRYQKVNGSDLIKILEGSIQYYALADDTNITMVEYIEHLNARSSGPDDSMKTMQRRFDDTVLRAHGGVIPPCPP